MTRIGLAGDWHSKWYSAVFWMKAHHLAGVKEIYHVGDFGAYGDRDGLKYLRAVDKQLKLYGMRMKVTLGNHEDYPYVMSLPADEEGIRVYSENLLFLPRGYRWEIDGTTFASLGGAASINFTSLKENISWWPEEVITMGDIYRLSMGGPADVFITHDAPLGIGRLEQSKAESEHEWTDKELAYAHQSQIMAGLATDIVRPKIQFHGHYHLDYRETVQRGEMDPYTTEFIGLNRDMFLRNSGVLDCETLEFNWIDGTGREIEDK